MKRGFTLVEFLIYITLVSLVVTSLVLWVLSLTGVRDKNYAVAEVQANSRMILSAIVREVKAAAAVVSPAPGTAAGSLELVRPNSSPNVRFEMSGGTLWLAVAGGTSIAISSRRVEVVDLSFINLAAALDPRANLQVRLTLRYRDPASADFAYRTEVATAVSLRQ